MTERYGELLKEFYNGIRNNNLAENRLNDIARVFNELSDTIEKRNTRPSLDEPSVFRPTYRSSPLRVFHCVLSTDTLIANNTGTVVTFETSWGDRDIFNFHDNDNSKIRIPPGGLFNMNLQGMLMWAANATGYRFLSLTVFDEAGSSLASQTLHCLPGTAVEDPVLPISYCENVVEIFPSAAYMQFNVLQTSGGNLNLKNFVLSVGIA